MLYQHHIENIQDQLAAIQGLGPFSLGIARTVDQISLSFPRPSGSIKMSPTYTMDVAHALDNLIQLGATGLYYAANTGRCSWYEFAGETIRLVGLDAKVEPVPSSFYPTRARRPRDSSLDNSLIRRRLNQPFRTWQSVRKRAPKSMTQEWNGKRGQNG